MKTKHVAIILFLIGCCVIPIGLIFLIFNAMWTGWDYSILKGLLNELE